MKKMFPDTKSIVLGIIRSLQAVASIVLIVAIMKLNILPISVMAPVCIIALVLFVATGLFQMLKSKARYFGTLLSVLLTLVFSIAAVAMFVIGGTVSDLTNTKEPYDRIVVVTNRDSEINELVDIEDVKIGVHRTIQKDLMLAAEGWMIENFGKPLNVVEYDTYMDQVRALERKEVDVIIHNSAFRRLIIEQMPDYSLKFKIIYEYDLATKGMK